MVNPSFLSLAPGLYFVATPIGAARDITLHALDLLASADLLVAEDTRSLKRLMQIHGIALNGRQVRSYHDHSGDAARQAVLAAVRDGQSVVYAPEAGTAMISDPGYVLARDMIAAGLSVHSAPGPSALLTAVTLSGLPSDRVLFCGFPPQKGGARTKFLADVSRMQATVVLYEAPGRVRRLLKELCDCDAAGREAALCRELTKRFEEVMRGTVAQILDTLGDQDPRGECVLVVGPATALVTSAQSIEEALDAALDRLSLKDAVAEVAQSFDLPRRDVYQTALSRQKARQS